MSSDSMREKLTLHKLASIGDGFTSESTPYQYKVLGLPPQQVAFVIGEHVTGQEPRWRFQRTINRVVSHSRVYKTPEEALTALEEEIRKEN